jgi:amidase
MARGVAAGALSARALTEAALARIAEVNARLGAVVALRAEAARRDADAIDRAVQAGRSLGPLAGVPMTVKDSFDTCDLVSTWGTVGRAHTVPYADATAVRRLREAGAILLGKTNTPELTLGFHTHNALHGHTRNPHALDRSPGGSSGGAAAIVAAGGSAFDIGTDTGGSIRVPAHCCGVAGIRPTSGRVSRAGHAIGPHGPLEALTQVGPLARRVDDLRVVLAAVAGRDGADPAVVDMPLFPEEPRAVTHLRVAVYADNGAYTPSAAVAQCVETCAASLAATGAKVRAARPPGAAGAQDLFVRLMMGDGGAWVRALLAEAGTPLDATTLRWVPAVLRRDPASTARAMRRALDEWQAFRAAMNAFMEDFDVILCPPAGEPALSIGDAERDGRVFAYTMPYNLTGWPAAVVPVGRTSDGLPIGVQIVCRAWDEALCLDVAEYLEEKLGGYRSPSL